MTKSQLRLLSNGLAPLASLLVIALMVQTVPAATIAIQFTGLDLVYDGSTIVDAGTPTDDLTTMSFLVDGTTVDTLLTGISVDADLGQVLNIPVNGGNVSTGPSANFFNLLLPDIGLALDLNDVTVTYLPIPVGPSTIDFVFAGSLADIVDQSLPSGLVIGDPVTVSFSTSG